MSDIVKIGDVVIKGKTVLAPMAGVNCTSFRAQCKEHGASLIFTQMYDVETIIDKDAEGKLEEFLNILNFERPIAIQLIGNIKDDWKTAVEILNEYADIIDINLGCPETDYIEKEAGSWLMQKPEQVKEIAKICVEAAKRLPKVPFKVAGNFDRSLDLVRQIPPNIEFTGQLDSEALIEFYAQARMILAPSKWYEGLPMAVIEAMLSGKPVVCSNIGGLPEIVDEGITGLLFHHDDAKGLTEKIQTLWNDQELCRIMGMAARKKAEKAYSPNAFYQRFMNACEIALRNKTTKH